MPGLIAIVGRPNVGKSALFNRIVGRRIAIVHDQPGVTRDRVTAQAEWHGRPFTLVDTGGIGLLRREKADDIIVRAALEQVQIAIEAANVIILVVNVQEGIVPLDREAAARLRHSGKPVLVAVNKVDTHRVEVQAMEFAELGFDKTFPVSAIHGEGIEPLLDAAVSLLAAPSPSPPLEERAGERRPLTPLTPEPSSPLKLAILGRPNVGKSSIVNALTHSERVVVTPIPGTTRDSVDVPFEVETEGVRQSYVLIDTAGRMQTNQNLMDQMKKIKRVAKPNLILYIGDALAGNDAIEQAKQFHEAVGLDGIVLTKIDADAKGGAALSMAKTIGKPVVFVNVGQTYKDIRRFETKWMVDRLLAEA